MNATNDDVKGALDKRDNQEKAQAMTFDKLIEKHAVRLVGDERAAQFAATWAIMKQRDAKLAQCTPTSLYAAMMSCIHLDLLPNTPEQYAFIIPYRNNKLGRMEAQFQVGYYGQLKLAYNSGAVSHINAEIVFRDDVFKLTAGTDRKLIHEPNIEIDRTLKDFKDFETRAKAVYTTAVLRDGNVTFEVMNKSELEKVYNVVKAKGAGKPWGEWIEPMLKKTVLKRMGKYLPKSNKDNRFELANYYDSLAEAGKLRADESGNIIEGEIADEPVQVKPSALVRSYAEAEIVTEVTNEPTAPKQQDQPVEETLRKQPSEQLPVPDRPEPEAKTAEPDQPPKEELNNDQINESIKAMIAILKIGKMDENKLFVDVIGKINIKSASNDELMAIRARLKNMCKEKGLSDVENVQSIFGGDVMS